MSQLRGISHTPTFREELRAIPSNFREQVESKLEMLETDPEPDAKTRKSLKGQGGLYRLRCGDYRVFYSYDDEYVTLYSVRLRSDDTYDDMPEVEEIDRGRVKLVRAGPTREDFAKWTAERDDSRRLPEAVSEALLRRIGVPPTCWPRLLEVETENELLECPGVADEHLLRIHEHMFVKPIPDVLDEKLEVSVGGLDDLFRYAEGEVVPFLLRMDAVQERVVSFAVDASGPTLVRGGPGTGKSTVALYRIREIIKTLRASGVEHPRVLFTTYTNALVTFSRQLLEALLGDDAACVEVRTADSLVADLLRRFGKPAQTTSHPKLQDWWDEIWDSGPVRQQGARGASMRQALERLGSAYVLEEILQVIQGRGLTEVDQYLAESRVGRRVPLRENARRAVWAAHEAFAALLARRHRETWQQSRARAARLVAARREALEPWDAVVVDEAQDLDLVAIRMLVDLCGDPSRMFLTADGNQSIFSSGFAWKDVHDSLNFVGRASVLRSNYRSTQEVIEAARDYLEAGLPDDLAPDEQTYVHSGHLPVMRRLGDPAAEADLVARYLRQATRELRLTIGSGAVLVPSHRAGKQMAEALLERGLPAVFRSSKDFEIDDNTVSVMPMQGAKGLEFAAVAVAGFTGSGFPHLEDSSETIEDSLVRIRRLMFVAMTRAMRTLLVVCPTDSDSMLWDGFDPELWNVGENA